LVKTGWKRIKIFGLENSRLKYLFLALLLFCFSCAKDPGSKILVLISANAEWKVVKSIFPNEKYEPTPWGEFFETEIKTSKRSIPVLFFHEGWGKTAAAGGTQYAIDRWNPDYMINFGTCGGFEGRINRFDVLLVTKTIIYDIKEAMGDSKQAIDDYTTEIDLSGIKVDAADSVKTSLLVSADKDLVPSEITELKEKYNAIAGDWESGAIAYTCKRNNKKLLILRGVTDIVTSTNGEAYHHEHVFLNGTDVVMKKLIRQLPNWLEKIQMNQ